MQISIDPQMCTGHGRCYTIAPDLFDPDEEGRGVVTHVTVPDGLEEQARGALSGCPERAVILG